MDEKSKTKKLKEELFMPAKTGIATVKEDELKKADEFCEGYKKFLDNSPVEREAVRYSVALAEANGFTPFEQDKKYSAGDKVYYINRDKAVALAVIGKNGTKDGVRLSIAHIDSPRVDLKPNPLYEDTSLAFFKTHYYGGIKKYQWTVMPLALHGTVVKLDGTRVDIQVGSDESEPCFCITDLLPHLYFLTSLASRRLSLSPRRSRVRISTCSSDRVLLSLRTRRATSSSSTL